jgi:ABC-type branched-subunit amino acid transport system substrate-binding protein
LPGFKNGQGITDKEITIATSQDVSGPVPGLFQGAQQAMKAFVAYFNNTSSICGRKLKLLSFDSQTSSGGDQQAATSACSQAFAIIGSMGAFDDGGAQTVTKCGIPDLRAATTTGARSSSPVVYAVQSVNPSDQPTSPADYYKKTFPGVEKNAAFVGLTAGAASINGEAEMKGWKARGYNFVYSSGIPVTEFNYTSYVNAMKSKNVTYVQYVGAYQNAVRLKQAMAGQNFNPLFVLDPVAYDPGFAASGGSAVEGTHVWINSHTFEEAAKIPEMQLYNKWVQATSGKQSYFGLFAWAAGRLFTQEAIKLGGQLTRQSLLSALSKVDNYTGFGLFGPQHVGKKVTGSCYGFIVLQGGKWVRDKNAPQDFYCGTTVNVGATG